MKTKIVGDSAVISTLLTKAMIATLEKHAPDALRIKDDKDNTIFMVGFGKTPSVTENGVVFSGEDAESKQVFAVVAIPAGTADAKAYLADKYAVAMINLADVESAALNSYPAVIEELEDIAGTIEVISVV